VRATRLTRLGKDLAIGTWLLSAALMAVGCHGPQAYLKGENAPLLTYERTMCFGSCPAFKLDIQADGHVYFNGRAHTKPLGKYRAQWPESDLQKLAQTAANLRLDKKAGTYDNPMIMDLPSTRLRFGNHQVLDRIDGPDLKELYVLLDSLIATTTWSPEPR
jgi:hypothetical protein